MKEKELIRSHPYFVEEKGDTFYLQHTGDKCAIVLGFEIDNDFPVKWFDYNENSVTIWQTEKWFQELYVEVNELYFKLNRVKMITHSVKRSIENTIQFSCINQKDGEKVRGLLEGINTFNKKCMSKKYEPLLLRIKEKLEYERYEVSLKEENDEELSLTIY